MGPRRDFSSDEVVHVTIIAVDRESVGSPTRILVGATT